MHLLFHFGYLISFFLLVSSEATKKRPSFNRPKTPSSAYFAQYFHTPGLHNTKFVISKARKDNVATDVARYDAKWTVDVPELSAIDNDYALVLQSKARHAAIASPLRRPFRFDADKSLVMQYEVRFQNGHQCGGAYVKLLSQPLGTAPINLEQLDDKTNYTIMFGPDRCGNQIKIHLIFRFKNKVTGVVEEKHLTKPVKDGERYFTDKRTHLYTLVMNNDNTFQIFVDQTLINSGNMLKDASPAVNPPEEIDDPEDKKPADWDDRAKIPDSKAVKPDDWDESAPEYIPDKNAKKPEGWLDEEPLTIADPKAVQPKDWDKEMDGEWEAPRIDNPACSVKGVPGCGPWNRPTIKNPAYKGGKWRAPLVANPDYKGEWKARRIANPAFYDEQEPFKRLSPIGAVALELWSMDDGVAFDNFLLVDKKEDADHFAEETWLVKNTAERLADPNAHSVVDAVRLAFENYPWLWTVLIGFIGGFIFLMVYCCCWPFGSKTQKQQPPTADIKMSEKPVETSKTNGEAKAALEKSDEEDSVAPSGDKGDENIAAESETRQRKGEEKADGDDASDKE